MLIYKMKFVVNELNLVTVSNIRMRLVFSTILKKCTKCTAAWIIFGFSETETRALKEALEGRK